MSTPGDFSIVFGVTDSIGQASTVEIIVRNVSIELPEVELNGKSVITLDLGDDWDDPGAKAIDFEGESLTVEVDGEVDTSKEGTYPLIYRATDMFGNTEEKLRIVIVNDDRSPDISGPEVIHKHAEYILSPDFFLDYFEAYDHEGTEIETLEIVDNELVGNAATPGTYLVEIIATDENNNSAHHTLEIHVVETMIPLLIIDEVHLVIDDTKLTINDIVNAFRVSGIIEDIEHASESILDNYSENHGRPGNYQWKFELISASGIEETFDITIESIQTDQDIHEDSQSFIYWIESNWELSLVILIFIIVGGYITKKR